jgi:hypothetical protein
MKNSHLTHILCCLAACCFISCATPARVNEMRISSMDSVRYDGNTPLKNNVTVSSVTGGKGTNPLWTSEISSESYKEALMDSLIAVKLLSEDTEAADYDLRVEMLKVKQPLIGVSLSVTTIIEYWLTRTSDHQEVLHETVEATYTAKFSDAFLALERLKLANEGAGRENVTELIDRLYQLDLPAGSIAINQQ